MAEVESHTNGSTEEPNALEKKIIRQIEYYFGDHNLAHDKFLKNAVKENDGWVSLEILIKFNRLKSLSTDFEVITGALKKSLTQLMEVSDDGKKVRRSLERPLPDDNPERQNEITQRSIYAKGFPLDVTLDQLIEFFNKHGNVENIYMRRCLAKSKKPFKGSVFAVFPTKEEAEKFVSEEKILFGEKELLREFKADYHKRKGEEFAKLKEERKKKKEEKQQNKKTKVEVEDDEEEAMEFDKGCILHLTGFKDTSREDIKEVFDNYAKVAWIDFKRGDTQAWVRFEGEGNASLSLEKAKEANNGKLEIKGAEIEAKVLTGEEEEEHWRKLKQAKEESRQRKEKGRKNKGNRGGYRGGRNSRGRSRVQEIMQKRGQPKIKKFDDSDESGDIPDQENGNKEKESEVANAASQVTEGQSKKTKLETDDTEGSSAKKMKLETSDS